MTLYISRSVATSQPQRFGLSASVLAASVAVADPPLLTHVWRRFFEQRTRQEVRR
ncbi:multiple cyclophane-containing RiPP AmcA [Micromonospora echinospora]|uniref:multiple cyclophane-containing RiPP AmcA n=1 Tax=Micromonospora echinospora TaxID=1877 RepID=UPI0037A89571